MRRRFILLMALAVGSLTVAVTAWAGAPHMLRFTAPTLVDGGSLSGSSALAAAKESSASVASDPRVFVEEVVVAGVKEGVTTRLSAPFEAVYVCVNGGGQVPSAENKLTFVGNLEASASFPAAKNGKATGSLLTGPLPSPADAAAAAGFSCPSGQTLEFDHVVFSNMVLSVDGGESILLDTVLVSDSLHGVS
jgi:hypothetical protein